MEWGAPSFVLAVFAIVMATKIINTAIRAKHGYPVEDSGCGKSRRSEARADDLDAHRKAELLGQENDRLKGQVSRLEERIAVLERIATDAPSRLSREIDALR